jgi:hypothetical protein
MKISAQLDRTRLQSLQQLASNGKIVLPANLVKPKRPTARKKVPGSLFSGAVIEGRR